MSEKTEKKIRQLYRRDAHKEVEKIRNEILKQMNFLRPKPKWVPLFIWRLFYKIVFKN
jgi:hypothetical protein